MTASGGSSANLGIGIRAAATLTTDSVTKSFDLSFAVAVITPPQSVAFSSPEVSHITKWSSPSSSSILVRKAISPRIMTLGALFTVKAMPATVSWSRSGRMRWGSDWSRWQNSRSTSLTRPA